MSDPSATYSDLELAGLLSQRLVGHSDDAAPSPAPPYTRFAATLAHPAGEARPAAAPVRPPIEAPTTFPSWEQFLAWVVASSSAMAAFVMDPEGFAIAAVGDLDAEQAQALGVHLMVALSEVDQPDHPGARALSLSVEYPPFTLAGMRVTRSDGAVFTLGVTAPEHLTAARRESIRGQAAFNLQHL